MLRVLSLAVRAALVPVNVLLLFLQRLAWRWEPPRYAVRGGCQRSGHCCRRLLLVEDPFLTWPVLRTLVAFWMQRIYPFEITATAVLDPDTGEHFRIVTCRNRQDGGCREYFLRPRCCRAWPTARTAEAPMLFRGCGFTAEDTLAGDGVDVSRRRNPDALEAPAVLVSRWKQQK